MKKVLIDGFYGHDNLGDDYILYSILNTISDINEELQIDIICDPEYKGYLWINQKFPNITFSQLRMPHNYKYFKNLDYWIIGGGGLFPKENCKILLKKYLLMTMAKSCKTKICMYGIEINPVHKSINKKMWDLIRKKCDFIFLRNKKSKLIFKKDKRIRTYSDATFSLKTDSEKISSSVEIEKKYTLYALAMPWSNDELKIEKYKKRYNQLISQIMECINCDIYMPVFISFYESRDSLLIKDLTKRCERKYLVIDNNIDIAKKRLYFKYATKCVCMRYHSVLFALYNSTPFWAISYSPKTSSLLNELGLQNRYLEFGIRDSEFFYREFDLDNQRLKELANFNFDKESIKKQKNIEEKLKLEANRAAENLCDWIRG